MEQDIEVTVLHSNKQILSLGCVQTIKAYLVSRFLFVYQMGSKYPDCVNGASGGTNSDFVSFTYT
jgi:hypothetical protein